MSEPETTTPRVDFVREKVRGDQASGKYGGRVQTRFPPEPNGFPHIGHAKAIALDFGIAAEFGGTCKLRFDDTNPVTEESEFVEAIVRDVRWLGYEPAEIVYASDYFGKLYEWAEYFIERGLAYVDDQSGDEISAGRGGYGKPGTDSPFRERSIGENLALFRAMRAGECPDGSRVLRAKIDMNHENMQMRDPVMYRIRHAHHYRTGDAWCIYPTYDWAHGQSDAIEGVTHSLCTLEFDSHRPLYDWYLAQLPLDELGFGGAAPEQSEFARLNLTYTITSKRKVAALVNEGHVDGWDDPRMTTLSGLRRRGYPPAALRAFCQHIGVAKVNGTHEIELLESFVRDELNRVAQRRMAVLDPIKLVITNWPDGLVEMREVGNNPENPDDGTRMVPFSGELWIERDDFMEEPAPKYFRLSPGREVRLRSGYLVTATGCARDEAGNVTEVYCTYDPATAGGQAPDGRKVKSTIHWVSVAHAIEGTAITYDRLFTDPHPADHDDVDPLSFVNPNSRTMIRGAKFEPGMADIAPGGHVQFERLAYYCRDAADPWVFHQTVGLRDEWARLQKRA